MVIKNIVQVGNPIIRKRSSIVKNIKSSKVRLTIKNLVDSMRKHNLVGMAAPQIGENTRVFVTEVRKTKFRSKLDLDSLRVFINPKIIKSSQNKRFDYEGCGSVANAGLFAKVKRSTNLTVSAYDEMGKKFKLETWGLLAVIIQHEIDHLDGKVFLDREFDPNSLMSLKEYLEYKKKLDK